jgi:hypothetical protein
MVSIEPVDHRGTPALIVRANPARRLAGDHPNDARRLTPWRRSL